MVGVGGAIGSGGRRRRGRPEGGGDGDGETEYERRREERIRENQARMEALGLPGLVGAVRAHGGGGKRKGEGEGEGRRKGKGKAKEEEGDDDEYRPSDEDAPHSDEEDDEEEEKGSSSSSRRRKKKNENNKSLANKGRVRKELFLESGVEDEIDDEVALQQAIALSLGESAKDSGAKMNKKVSKTLQDALISGVAVNKEGSEGVPRGKRSKENARRVQMTEDEAITYFFSFDVAGKGKITPYDLRRMVMAHDFSWSEREMADMIHSFDNDGDGKLSLDEFHNILSRLKIISEPQNS